MEITSIPIIVIICYLIGEIYKVIFKTKEELYKLIPIVLACIGGILGVLIYLTNKDIMLNATSIWESLIIGIISGNSSTGTNQIIKQIFIKNNK